MAVSTEDEPRLHELFQENSTNDILPALNYTIITIPDFDVRSVATTWRGDSNDCWLQSNLQAAVPKKADVLSFEPGLQCGKDFSWQHVLRQGDRFLEEMLSFQARGKLGSRPILFICHGLGGFLLKRAISVLSERFYDPEYQRLMSTIAGVIFLGCPSPKVNRPRDLERVSSVLKFVTKHNSKSRRLSSSDVAASISQRFSESGFEAPVLSVFENSVSKITRAFFSPRQVLVDQSLCETFTRRERLVGVDCTHDELSLWRKDNTLGEEIAAFFTMALELWSVNGSLRTISNEKKQISIRAKPIRVNTSFDPWADLDPPSLSGATSPVAISASSSSYADSIRMPFEASVSSPSVRRLRALLPCYRLPHDRNDGFFGRDDVLTKIDRALLPSSKDLSRSLSTFALCGVGGVGKSQAATEFVFSRKHHFDAIFWLHAADGLVLANEFAQIASHLGLGSHDNRHTMDDIVARNLVLQWLSNPGGDARYRGEPVNWLMVFDNAENISMLKDYWPVSGTGSILVTSRDPLAKTQIYAQSSNGIDLEPFTIDEAAAWLRSLTHYNAADDIGLSKEIVTLLSRLPLAIAQVAGAMLRRGLSFSEFLHFYSEESFRVDIYQSVLWQKPIWATFAFEALSPGAATLLYVMCFFNPDAISERVFTTHAAARKRAKDLGFVGYPMNDMAYVAARTELTSTSLVKRNVKTQELTIHRVVQDAAMASMDAKRLTNAFRLALSMLSAAWPDSNFDFSMERWKLSEPLLPHVLRCVSQYEMSQTLQASQDFNNEFAELLQNAGW